jgi:malonyl-CoA/methylmalonyl-CoA synthetase
VSQGPLGYGGAESRETFGAVLEARAAAAPGAPLLVFGRGAAQRVWSFAEIEAWSRQIAARLLDRGVASGDRCALGLANSPELFAALLAIVRTGAIAVPLNPRATPDEAAYVFSHADVAAAIVGPQHACEAARRTALVFHPGDSLLAEPAGGTARAPLPDVDPASAALLVYTSGTTGRPKGALLAHRALTANMRALASLWGWTSADRLLLTLPCFHLHGLGLGCAAAVVVGSSVVLRDGFDAADVPSDLEASAATMFFGVPTMYVRLCDLPVQATTGIDLARMRLWVSGSAPLSPAVHERFAARFGARIVERYGMSEGGFMLSTRPGFERPGRVGWPVPGVECRIASEDGAAAGELRVRGSSLFLGYWRDTAATAASYLDGWFRTGDVANLDAEGVFSIVGRLSTDIVKSRGFKIGAVEIEQRLMAHAAVAEAAVIGVPDEDQGQRLVAFVIPAQGLSPNAGELDAFLRQSLAAYKIPGEFRIVADVPRVGPGKVNKRRLLEDYVPDPKG